MSRLAVLLAPASAPLDEPLEVFARAGFSTAVVHTTPSLEPDFARAVAGAGAETSVLVYLAASTRLESDGLALRAGEGEEATWVPLRALGDTVRLREPRAVLVMLDARHDGDVGDAMLAAEHVDEAVRALDARTRGWSVLAGVRSEASAASSPGAWPFTGFVLRAMQDREVRDEVGVARLSRVYERVRATPDIAAFVQSFALVKGHGDFDLSDPALPKVIISEIPVPAESAPVSLAPAALAGRPDLAQVLEEADDAREDGRLEDALVAYKKALMLVPEEDAGAKASIYAHVGEVKIAQGKLREAELNFEKALARTPGHRRSIDALVDLAVQGKEPKRAIAFRRTRLEVLTDDNARVRELVAIATIQSEELKDLRAAAESLEEAHAIVPTDAEVLERSLAIYEGLHRWPRVVDVLASMASACRDTKRRAELRFREAEVAIVRLRDEALALELLERALDDDPTHAGATDAIVALLQSREGWRSLDAVYTRLIEKHAQRGDAERAWEACRHLGALRRDKLADLAAAVEAYTGAVSLKPGDRASRTTIVDLHLARGDDAAAAAELEAIAALDPEDASSYERLYVLHHRAGHIDRAWLVAGALEELSAADVDVHMFLSQHRPAGPIRPGSFLDHDAWDQYLGAPGSDPVVTGILGAIVPAAVKVKVDELRANGQLAPLDPAARQPRNSTATVVRSFVWASQVLGVTLPELYVLDQVPGGMAAVRVEVPSTALGPEVLGGLSAAELAFLAGRQLAYYRPEHYALVFFPSLPELSVLFLAAVKLALPEVPLPGHLAEATARLRQALVKHVTEEERAWVKTAVATFEERGGRVDLAAWVRSVELTATRAGFLLCGDLAVAMKRLRAEARSIADVTLEDRRHDLLTFSASTKLASLRSRLALKSGPLTIPPSASSAPPPPRSSAAPPPPPSRRG